jgi:hypothetical protein
MYFDRYLIPERQRQKMMSDRPTDILMPERRRQKMKSDRHLDTGKTTSKIPKNTRIFLASRESSYGVP